MEINKVPDPYKILFTLGVLSGVVGVSLWILFKMELLSFYPKVAHAQIMFFGFMWSFVAGFLMTAIPRMTGTHFSNIYEVIVSCGLVFGQNVINFFNQVHWGAYLFLLQNIFLIYFIVPRFLQKRRIPFSGFLFMPVAFLNSFVGAFLYLNLGTDYLPALFLFSGEAFLLNLILGLGSRMIPALSRLPNAFMHPGISEPIQWKKSLFIVSFLNLGYWFEFFGLQDIGVSFRLSVLCYIALTSFGLFKRSQSFTWLGVGLKFAVSFMILGHIMMFSWFSYRLAGLHLLYIGGFALVTMMVATRVTLAHSQVSLDYEQSSKRIASLIFIFVLATVFRWLAGPMALSSWILFSSLLFIGGLFLWLTKHIHLILYNKATPDKDH